MQAARLLRPLHGRLLAVLARFVEIMRGIEGTKDVALERMSLAKFVRLAQESLRILPHLGRFLDDNRIVWSGKPERSIVFERGVLVQRQAKV